MYSVERLGKGYEYFTDGRNRLHKPYKDSRGNSKIRRVDCFFSVDPVKRHSTMIYSDSHIVKVYL